MRTEDKLVYGKRTRGIAGRRAIGFFVLLSVFIALPLPARLAADEAPGLMTGSEIGDRLLVDLGAVGLGGLGLCANFALMGALGADGELSWEERLLASSMTELSSLPLFALGSEDAIPLSLIGAGFLGAEALSAAGGKELMPLTEYLYWTKFDLSLYKMYSGYAEGRLASKAWDNSGFKKWSLPELYAAPFDPEILRNPLFWASVGAGTAFYAVLMALTESDDQSVWKTGDWYMGNEKSNPGLFLLANGFLKTSYSLAVGAGEEAFFRGFLYEEISDLFGPVWGMAIDAAAFTAIHFVTDLVRGNDWPYILIHTAGIAIDTVLLDLLYESGGLPASVAAHAWVDIIALNSQSVLFGGVPAAARRWPTAALSIGWSMNL